MDIFLPKGHIKELHGLYIYIKLMEHMTYTETKVLDIFRTEGRVKELVSISIYIHVTDGTHDLH